MDSECHPDPTAIVSDSVPELLVRLKPQKVVDAASSCLQPGDMRLVSCCQHHRIYS